MMYGHPLMFAEHAEALAPTPEQIERERAAAQARQAHDQYIDQQLMNAYELSTFCEDF